MQSGKQINSVTGIGEGTFVNCINLNLIINLNPVPVELYSMTFYNVPQTCTLKVPLESVLYYEDIEGWKDFNIVGIEK